LQKTKRSVERFQGKVKLRRSAIWMRGFALKQRCTRLSSKHAKQFGMIHEWTTIDEV